MQTTQDEIQQLEDAFKESARDFLSAVSPLSRIRALRNTDPGYERAIWHKMAQAGWTGLLIPESLGGLEQGLRAAAAIAVEVGRSPLPEPYIASAIHPAAVLTALPATRLRDELLSRIAAGELIAGVAWQEASDVALTSNAEATVVIDGDHARICAVKRWVYPANADGWLVTCRHSDMDAICWVPAASHGVIAESHERVDGSLAVTLHLNQAAIPASHLLAQGDEVQPLLEQAKAQTRAVQAAELLGIATEVFGRTLEYLKTRIQFGKPIGANQALQHRMVDAYLQVELAQAVLKEFLAVPAMNPADFAAGCARVKARCAHAALHVTRLSIQFHGAIGYTDELDIGLYFKRALHLNSWLGGVLENRRLALQSRETALEPANSPADSAIAAPADGNWNAMSEPAFRATVRQFIKANYPEALRNPPQRLHWKDLKDWYLSLSSQGWIAPAWPREHGGMGLEPDKLIAFFEEMEAYGVARMPDQGIINIGPVLIKYGTEKQRRQYLPKIIAGEHIWCQGYSEPNAGSDLASLRTEAVLDGDEFVVNGQKIWTTLAQDATHIFMLVRTDKEVKKQAGISFLLADMKTPGITVRPIRNLGGEEEFCEVFFDNVRVPKENLVGALNQGWTIAKALLDFERIFVGSPNQSRYALNQLRLIAQQKGLFNDQAFLDRYAASMLDVDDLQALYAGYADIVKRGEALPPSVSLLKIWATETYSRIAMEVVEAAQEQGGDAAPILVGDSQITPCARLYNSAITTIYGGSNEIQRNILAKLVLGLPV
ncbi:MAG TPA: acyl-CoA dehydrogenase [Eoetvoesiella sp.]